MSMTAKHFEFFNRVADVFDIPQDAIDWELHVPLNAPARIVWCEYKMDADGNLFVNERGNTERTYHGRTLEVTAEGVIRWDVINPCSIGFKSPLQEAKEEIDGEEKTDAEEKTQANS